MGEVAVAKRAKRTSAVEWGVSSSVMHGESRSGDMHLVCETPAGTLLAVIDGIGHGAAAAEAAELTVHTLDRVMPAGVIQAVRRCHEALIGTRGVVLSLALIDPRDDMLTWIGVGNVSGVLLRADARAQPRIEELLARGGVVGMHLPQLQAAVCSIGPGDVVALATDGVRPGFADVLTAKLSPASLASRVLDVHARGTDDALALVARYLDHRERQETPGAVPTLS